MGKLPCCARNDNNFKPYLNYYSHCFLCYSAYSVLRPFSSVLVLCVLFLSIKESEAKKAKYFQRIQCGIIFSAR